MMGKVTVRAMDLPDGGGDGKWKWWAESWSVVDRIVKCCGGFLTRTFVVGIVTMMDGYSVIESNGRCLNYRPICWDHSCEWANHAD